MMVMSELELKALMVLSLDGDENAYRCLLGILRHLLETYFRRRLAQNGQDVDDLVQETLLALHKRRITYDRERPFTAWFFTIARHKLVDHHRQNRGGRSFVGLELVEEVAGGYSEEAVLANLDVQRLLASLPAWQSDLIRQVRLEGRSVAETASDSGKTQAMVKVGVHRGIKALAARLRGERDEN